MWVCGHLGRGQYCHSGCILELGAFLGHQLREDHWVHLWGGEHFGIAQAAGPCLTRQKLRVDQGGARREKGQPEATLEELLAILEGSFKISSFWAFQPCWVRRQGI